MKVFSFLLLFGIASASYYDMLDNAADGMVRSFLEEIEQVPSGKDQINAHTYYADEIDDEAKAELVKKLKETLTKVLEKVKSAIEEGKAVEAKFLDKIKEVRQQLKNLREEVGDNGKDLLDKIREKAREYLKNLLDKLGKNKPGVNDQVQQALEELSLRDILKKIKEHIKNNIDPDLLKEKVEKMFNQGSELLRQFLQLLKEKGMKKLSILIDRLLDEDEDETDREARGIKDYWEKVKDYFKDLKIDLQEKYMKFGEWVKTTLDKGMEKSKDKMENIKALAKEFAKHAKGISKEIANEAGEFFKAYKEELGNVWDEVKEKLQEIKNRKD